MTESQPTPQPETPWMRFTRTFTPLYRTLLILGIFAILLSLSSLTSISALFDMFSSDPFYAASSIITTLIVPAFMISSIILLWHKHPTGIKLRLAGYATSIVATILAFFTNQATLDRIVQTATEAAQQSSAMIDPKMMADLAESSFYAGLYIAIGASLLFAWLWWSAWKKQQKADTRKQGKKTD